METNQSWSDKCILMVECFSWSYVYFSNLSPFFFQTEVLFMSRQMYGHVRLMDLSDDLKDFF